MLKAFSMPDVQNVEDIDDMMALNGRPRAYGDKSVLWIFGHLEGSRTHEGTGTFSKEFLWVVADWRGSIIETFYGPAYKLPKSFDFDNSQEH